MSALPRVASSLNHACHIRLKGVPKTATPADIRRAVKQTDLQGLADVSVMYRRFASTGEAVLTMLAPHFARKALRAVKNLAFVGGGQQIFASLTVDNQFLRKRNRGVQGRADALNRGLLGSGPSAGFPPRTTVTINGLPGRLLVPDIIPLIEGFQLADNESNSIVQAPIPENKFSMFARFIVMLASESEAQRLVRKHHLTPFKGKKGGPLMRAEVIY